MKKIHDWELWDWKTIIGAPLIIAILVFFIYSMEILIPDHMRSHRSKKYSCTTKAHFIKWHRITNVSQGYTGSVTTTAGFEITYSYFVNNQEFIERDKVPNTTSFQKFLGKLQYDEIENFTIKYDPQDPSNSQIITDNKVYQLQ